LSTAAAKLRRLFNFHLLFYYDMAEVPSSKFNPRARRLLQLQSSLPTSSLVAANFNPRRHSNSKPVDVLFHPFSLMAAVVFLMLLLLDELLTKIIIHSIKDVAVFHFLNLRNKICGTFWRICNSDEVLLCDTLKFHH
jgi:hypothetical protein